ncbi:hypothetical protein P3W85_04625 [Cupriavidus basilensis]|uniref:Uncharacterized protein n=1 Tax=Cupriavidus basilensis TaxID=68895 RepID=A0ABT6AI00_9BURK|nr:hypothetical protein [Cupriavidus basilensis]MDF3832238.1 hypothetical protein [Cupriavidus basilensis]
MQARFAGVVFDLWFRTRANADRAWSPGVPPGPVGQEALAMTEAQHLDLLTLGYADKLTLQLRQIYGEFPEHPSHEALQEAVGVQIERAARYRIRSEGDMLQYVFKGLLISARFDEHPLIHSKLLAASLGDISFSEVLSLVGDACREEFKKDKSI